MRGIDLDGDDEVLAALRGAPGASPDPSRSRNTRMIFAARGDFSLGRDGRGARWRPWAGSAAGARSVGREPARSPPIMRAGRGHRRDVLGTGAAAAADQAHAGLQVAPREDPEVLRRRHVDRPGVDAPRLAGVRLGGDQGRDLQHGRRDVEHDRRAFAAVHPDDVGARSRGGASRPARECCRRGAWPSSSNDIWATIGPENSFRPMRIAISISPRWWKVSKSRMSTPVRTSASICSSNAAATAAAASSVRTPRPFARRPDRARHEDAVLRRFAGEPDARPR